MPGHLYIGGQNTIIVPEHTSCVYVMPDGSWNESAAYTSVFADCDRVAVTYQSNLPNLHGTYEYISGDYVLTMISTSLETGAILVEIRTELEIQDLSVVYRAESNDVVMIYLSDQLMPCVCFP